MILPNAVWEEIALKIISILDVQPNDIRIKKVASVLKGVFGDSTQ